MEVQTGRMMGLRDGCIDPMSAGLCGVPAGVGIGAGISPAFLFMADFLGIGRLWSHSMVGKAICQWFWWRYRLEGCKTFFKEKIFILFSVL